MRDEKQYCDPNVTSCCPQGSCCSPSSNGRRALPKTALLLLLVILAVGVTAHSLLTGEEKENVAITPPGVGLETGSLTHPASLVQLIEGKDFGLLVLGDSEEGTASALAGKVAARIETQAETVPVTRLDRGTETFEEAKAYFELTEFPAVVAMGKECAIPVYGEDITEDAILLACLKVSFGSGACDPGKGCCP